MAGVLFLCSFLEITVLAGIRDLVQWWHVPIGVLMAVIWLALGCSLLLKALSKSQYPKRIDMGRCFVIMLVTGVAVTAIDAAVFKLLVRIREVFELSSASSAVTGAIILPILTVLVAWLVIYAMIEYSMGKAFKVAIVPLLVITVLEGALTAGAAVPAVYLNRAKIGQKNCWRNFFYLENSMRRYFLRTGVPAEKLEDLIETNLLTPSRLVCPSNPSSKSGYFYLPADIQPGESVTKKLILCDFSDNHRGGRNGMFVNGMFSWKSNKDFSDLLELPENKDFAKALRNAEIK